MALSKTKILAEVNLRICSIQIHPESGKFNAYAEKWKLLMY